MEGITYEATTNFADVSKRLVKMLDPLFKSPWYLKGVRNGQYTWTRSAIFAKDFSPATARKHVKALEAGADKEWEAYHKMWEPYT